MWLWYCHSKITNKAKTPFHYSTCLPLWACKNWWRFPLTFPTFANFSLTTFQFPDFSIFSSWMVTPKKIQNRPSNLTTGVCTVRILPVKIWNNITAEGQLMDLDASCVHAEHEESVCWDCSDTCRALGRCGEVLSQWRDSSQSVAHHAELREDGWQARYWVPVAWNLSTSANVSG